MTTSRGRRIEREAITAFTNIENALMQLACHAEKARIVFNMIEPIVNVNDADKRDEWRLQFYCDLREHLSSIHGKEWEYIDAEEKELLRQADDKAFAERIKRISTFNET